MEEVMFKMLVMGRLGNYNGFFYLKFIIAHISYARL